MKKITALLLFVAVLLTAILVYADEPPLPPEPWEIDLGDGLVFRHTFEGFSGEQGEMLTGLYRDGELVYTVNEPLWPYMLYFSNDGMSFIEIPWRVSYFGGNGRWVTNPVGYAIRFFYRGEVVHYYEVSDLNTNPGSFIVSVSHIQWDFQRERYHNRDNNTFQITTRNGRYITFDLSTGLIISNKQATMTVTPMDEPTAVVVEGRYTQIYGYRVERDAYFRLRDIAYVLSGTSAQFSVDWDNENNAIILTSGEPYTPIGGELAGVSESETTAVFTAAAIFLDGEEVHLGAYNINGTNYAKLSQVVWMLGYRVSSRGEAQHIDLSINFRWRDIRPEDESNYDFVIPFDYYDIVEFADGMAIVRYDREFGIIDIESREVLIPFGQYDWIHRISGGMAQVTTGRMFDGNHSIMDIASGEHLLSFYGDVIIIDMSDGWAILRFLALDRGFALIDIATAEEIILPSGYYPRRLHNGLVLVENSGRHGLYDIESGEMIISTGAYGRINYLFNGMAFVTFGGAAGWGNALIDIATGEEIIPRNTEYRVQGVYNGMAILRRPSDRRVAIVDLESGEEIIPFGRYDEISNFIDGMAIVEFMGATAIVGINR